MLYRRLPTGLALVASLFLAGCSSGGDDGGTSGDTTAPVAETQAGMGGIRGIVLDEESTPLSSATVGILELGLTTGTDDSGAFALSNVPPGSYGLNVQRLGYESIVINVVVVADAVTEVTATLAALAIEAVFYTIIGPQDGFFNCMYRTPFAIQNCLPVVGNSLPNEARSVRFMMSAENWQTFVGELRWDQATAASSANLAAFLSYVGRSGAHWWCDSDGPSPNSFRYEQEDNGLESICVTQGDTEPQPEDDEVEELLIAIDTGFAGTSVENPPLRLVFQQRFEVVVSVFYGEPAPVDFTAFPDQ